MIENSVRLYDLLLAMFRSDSELRRFTALQGLPLDIQGTPLDGKGAAFTGASSLAATAARMAAELLERDLADAAFFDALVRRTPEREADIRSVQASIAPPQQGPRPPAQAASGDVASEYADFAQQLWDDLTAEGSELDVQDDAASWPWTAAAAVLGSFRVDQLKPLTEAAGSAATSGLASKVFVGITGKWVLTDDVRVPALARLAAENRLDEALACNADLADRRRDLIAQLLDGFSPMRPDLDSRELADLDAVLGWLEPLGLPLPVSRVSVQALAERRSLIQPLRTLAGKHFRGRHTELERLRAHIDGSGPSAILRMFGPGGAGKSSLIGRLLLELEDRAAEQVVPFAYIDFDRLQYDPRSPTELLGQITRQLRLLFATRADARYWAATESVAAGDDLEDALALLNLSAAPDLESQVVLIMSRLDKLQAHYGSPTAPPLVLVLDTFEEVQVRGPGSVAAIVDLVDRILRAQPRARIVVSGRADVPALAGPVPQPPMALRDLDGEAADAVLIALGVGDPDVRAMVLERFGANPLTLRLAADALQAGAGVMASINQPSSIRMNADVAREQIQGMLYRRILGHIVDPEIRLVAHPGLAVRRVTEEVIARVLAGPCGLDPARAPQLFVRLGLHVTLFESDGPDALRHRPDVRRLMLAAMHNDPTMRTRVQAIHLAAVAYYAGRPGTIDRAEEIYHRLMSGADPRECDRLWDHSLQPLLASALQEPLPTPARRWLARRFDPEPSAEIADWEQTDWEASAAARADSWLQAGEPGRALSVLAERTARLPGTSLHTLAARAHLARGALAEAVAELRLGAIASLEAGNLLGQAELAEQGIAVGVALADTSTITENARTLAVLCDELGDGARAVAGLTDALSALLVLDDSADAAMVRRELSRRVSALDRFQLEENVELLRRALRAVGPQDPALVVFAALETADGKQPVFVRDVFALERLLEPAIETAPKAFTRLAADLGLEPGKWYAGDLASLASSHGRVGQAISLGINFAPDPERAAATAIGDLLVDA